MPPENVKGVKIMNIKMKPDYSQLLGGLSAGGGMSNFLSDYASIKNGSYGKLMKSYYASQKAEATGQSTATGKRSRTSNVLDQLLEQKKNPKLSKKTQKANEDLKAGLTTLNASLSTLQSDKTYTDTKNGQSASSKTVAAVKAYVKNYNSVVTAAKGSTLTNKTSYVGNMMTKTAASKDKLAEIGIRVNENGTLLLDEAKLKGTDVSKVQEIFSAQDITSYGATVASRLQFAGAASSTGAAAETDKKADASASSLKADAKALASDALYASVKDKDGNDTGKYDVDKITATAKSFVSNYNSMFEAAQSSSNSGVASNLSYIREKTAANADTLKQFGISVNEKGRMSINEELFKKADMSEVQKFFKDYGSSVATNASLVDYYMTTQADAAKGYTAGGAYNVQGSMRYANTI